MSSWASKRRFMYGGTLTAIILAIVGYELFVNLYKPPTCFDGIMNGTETGVDCGGSCVRLCPSSFLQPIVSWTSFEQLVPGSYNIVAYITNPNSEGQAWNVPFHMVLFDAKSDQIVDKSGVVNLPPNRNTLAFLGSVPVGKRIPYRAFFEFTGAPDWRKKADTLTSLSVVDKKYSEDQLGSSLLVTLKNDSVKPIGRMSVYVVLSDANSNVVGFSKTIVDGIDGLGLVDAPFTWAENHQGKVVSIEVLPVAE